MSGAQAKDFHVVWPPPRVAFWCGEFEMWEMAPGRCKFHGFLLAYFLIFFFFTLNVCLLVFNSHRWFCRKISEGQSDERVAALRGISWVETSQTSVKLGRVRRLVYMRTGSNIHDRYSFLTRSVYYQN